MDITSLTCIFTVCVIKLHVKMKVLATCSGFWKQGNALLTKKERIHLAFIEFVGALGGMPAMRNGEPVFYIDIWPVAFLSLNANVLRRMIIDRKLTPCYGFKTYILFTVFKFRRCVNHPNVYRVTISPKAFVVKRSATGKLVVRFHGRLQCFNDFCRSAVPIRNRIQQFEIRTYKD